MNVTKVICKRCSSFSMPELSYRSHCENINCFESVGVNPITGKEILGRIADFHNLNKNLDCPHYKKKWFLIGD